MQDAKKQQVQPPDKTIIRPYPGIKNGNSDENSIVARNAKSQRDWVPHLTVLGVCATFFVLIWTMLLSQFENIYIDIRELRTDVKKMDSRLDSIEKDIAIIKTKLSSE